MGTRRRSIQAARKEVRTGYTEKTTFDLRPKGQFPYKSFMSGGHFGGQCSRQENSTNKGEGQETTLGNWVLQRIKLRQEVVSSEASKVSRHLYAT